LGCGESLQQALCDEAKLDVALICVDLASDGVAVSLGFAVQVLIAAYPAHRRHGRHPEVIAIGADDAQRLLERHSDLESQAIDTDDIQGAQSHVGRHQQDGSAARMRYRDEADEDADGAPQQVG
jgi:hypothetical protein